MDSIGLRGSGRGVEEAVTPGLSEPWRGGKLRELESFGAEVLHSPSPALKKHGPEQKKSRKKKIFSVLCLVVRQSPSHTLELSTSYC